MGILTDSDKAGIALGLFVFLIMVLIGLHGKISPVVVIVRALVGFVVAYVLGFMLSKVITTALMRAMAEERAKKRAERERALAEPENSAEAEERGGSEDV